MKYSRTNIPLNVPVIVTFEKVRKIEGLITKDESVFYFHSNNKSGSGPKYKNYKYTWTFRVTSNGDLTEGLTDIELLQKEEYSIF